MAGGVPAVPDIAPDAADIAARKTDEPGSLTAMETFALEGIEPFHHGKAGLSRGKEIRGWNGAGTPGARCIIVAAGKRQMGGVRRHFVADRLLKYSSLMQRSSSARRRRGRG